MAKWHKGGDIELDGGGRIEKVDQYKYLGVSQLMGVLKKETMARSAKNFASESIECGVVLSWTIGK